MPQDRESRNCALLRSLTPLPLFLLLGVMVYLPALRSYFVCDDFLHIAHVIEGRLPFSPEAGTGRFLRPLIGLSFFVEYYLWGLSPFGYHLANVLVHIANSLLVLLLALGLLPAGAPRRAFTAIGSGLIFLVFACHAEPVSWISGRTDVYATFFALLSLVCARRGLEVNIAHCEHSRASGATAWRESSTCFLIASLIGLGLALLTKESALALPFLLALLAAYLRLEGRIRLTRRVRAWMVAMAGILAGYFLIRYAVLGTFIGGYGARGHLRMSRDILAQATSRYSWRTFFPPLPDGMTEFFSTRATILGLAWLALLGLVFMVLILRAWRQKKAGMSLLLFCAFWIALLPVINVRIYWTNPEGERFLYLASVFGAIALAYGINHVPWRGVRWCAMGAAIVVQAYWLHDAARGWERAGAIAEGIVAGIQRQSGGGNAVLVNKPDSYDGHLVLRTGLPEALRHFGPAPMPSLSIEVLYAATLFQPDHGFLLEHLSDGTYRIAATDASSVMAEEDRGGAIETLATDSRRCTFRFLTPLHDTAIFYYDRERVHLFQ